MSVPFPAAGPIGNVVIVTSVNRAESPCVSGLYPFVTRQERSFIREMTGADPVLMGRETFDIHGPRPGRVNFVLTRDRKWAHEEAYGVSSASAAARIAGDFASLFVLGGSRVHWLMSPYAGRLLVAEYDDSTHYRIPAPEPEDFDPAEPAYPMSAHPLAAMIRLAKESDRWESKCIPSVASDPIGIPVEFWSHKFIGASYVRPRTDCRLSAGSEELE